MTSAPRRAGRRAEYAELTRRSILDAAQQLFTEHGYFATKVEDIAAAARVAPATVYAVGGGKNGLLRTLIEAATQAAEGSGILARIEAATDPHELVRLVVGATRDEFARWSGLMRQVVAAAPQEPGVRQSMEIAHASLRAGLQLTADRLGELDALRDGLSPARATEILWIYLCNAAWFVRTDDLGWPLEESAAWLLEVLPAALLKR
ncbi:TetR/AcrR family transcriptional regulator [Actinoplanes sp. RD1]|uniref:TetR/AcrR family transcriptional regulator n=1 Tax=Actinoplanes sp. RD1 TaxID=3064538 RepID=UPI00274147AC|nr:TetR/AcrR family transcriptional regulator [Actinoplanes sp. RD1]